jgi:hypothetical protein
LLQTVWGRIEDKFWLLLHKDRQFTSPQVQFRVLLGFDPTHDGDNMDIDQNGFALLAGTKLPRSHCLCLLSWKEAPAEAGAWKICQQFDAWPSHRRMPKYAVPTPLVEWRLTLGPCISLPTARNSVMRRRGMKSGPLNLRQALVFDRLEDFVRQEEVAAPNW